MGRPPLGVESLRGIFRQDYQDCLRWCWKLHKTLDAHEIANNSFSVLSVSSVVKFAENSVKAFWETADSKRTHL
jgi:hypothetical protein